IFIVPKHRENRTPPKPDPKPVAVTVTPPTPTVHSQPHPVELPPVAFNDAQPGDVAMPADTSDKGVLGGTDIVTPPDDGKPLAGAHLEYATNPAPAYPSSSLRAQEQGTVMLEVLVDVDGKPI